MIACKRSSRLRFPEDPGAGSDEIVVKEPLVEAPLPAAAVQGFQSVSAPLHSVKAAAGLSACEAVKEGLESVARSRALESGGVARALNRVVG